MDTKRINILILLLLIIAAGSSACSFDKINAQNPNKTETARTNNTDSAKSTYEQPKRISKDIIKSDVKTKK